MNSLITAAEPTTASQSQDLTVDATKNCTANGTTLLVSGTGWAGFELGGVLSGPGVTAGTVVQSISGNNLTANATVAAGSEPQVRSVANFPGVPWTNLNNGMVEDFAVASCDIASLNVNGPRSEGIQFGGFGLDALVPDHSNIVGVAIVIARYYDGGFAQGISDDEVYLTKNGVTVGSNRANGTLWTATTAGTEYDTYGGDGDIFDSELNYPDLATLGFWYKIQNQLWDSAEAKAQLDGVQLSIYYQTPSSDQLLMATSTIGRMYG